MKNRKVFEGIYQIQQQYSEVEFVFKHLKSNNNMYPYYNIIALIMI